MSIILRTRNDFYEGWLANVLLVDDNEEATPEWREGWQMAKETGENAVLALRPSISQKHIHVEVATSPYPWS